MATITICDECGDVATTTICGMTGRVLIDGIDNNRQACDLCDKHKPPEGAHQQPNDCTRVEFYWPGMPEWNRKE